MNFTIKKKEEIIHFLNNIFIINIFTLVIFFRDKDPFLFSIFDDLLPRKLLPSSIFFFLF